MRLKRLRKKEDFCGACAAIPLAVIGAAGAGVGAKNHSKYKKIISNNDNSFSLVRPLI